MLERPKPASSYLKKNTGGGGGGDIGGGLGPGGGGGGSGGGGGGDSQDPKKKPDKEPRRISQDERFAMKGSIARTFVMANLVNATEIDEGLSPFAMLRHITTIRDLIDDKMSPY